MAATGKRFKTEQIDNIERVLHILTQSTSLLAMLMLRGPRPADGRGVAHQLRAAARIRGHPINEKHRPGTGTGDVINIQHGIGGNRIGNDDGVIIGQPPALLAMIVYCASAP
jgi:hypothetical protein